MPNLCSYAMRVVGKKKDVEEFFKVITCNYDYTYNNFTYDRHMYRIFSADSEDFVFTKHDGDVVADTVQYKPTSGPDDIIETEIVGSCAWSVSSCMMEGTSTYYTSYKKEHTRGTTLAIESKNLNLLIEVFSEESGVGFMEHIRIIKGEIEVDDCVEWCDSYEDANGEEVEASGGIEWMFSIDQSDYNLTVDLTKGDK